MRFGTGGVPVSCPKKGTIEGIKWIKHLGLDGMELEFVRGVRMGEAKAREVKKVAEQLGVLLTAHGPYYINLNSADEKKRKDSVERIYRTAKIGFLCGAFSITFHAAYYGGNKQKCTERVKEGLKEVLKRLEGEGIDIWVRPETTGKNTQWGTLEEILEISQELEKVAPCVDFAHIHARYFGRYNSEKEWEEMLAKIADALGKEMLKEMHIHFSGIEYGKSGEKRHLNLQESDFNYQGLVKVLKKWGCDGIMISESPNLEGDALLMKKTWEKTKV